MKEHTASATWTAHVFTDKIRRPAISTPYDENRKQAQDDPRSKWLFFGFQTVL